MTQRRRPKPDKAAPQPPREAAIDSIPVVALGASAGGLEAFQRFFDVTPADTGMAFILVQLLDPTHPSMLVELLASHTAMKVQPASEGERLQRNCVYVIPPGVFLSMRDGVLHISEPLERHGARRPFDFLLRSLAEDLRAHAIGVILSGTGADGSLGLKAVKDAGGLVIAQDPGEAGFDGMPQSAILSGVVDLVLPVAKIPRALIERGQRISLSPRETVSTPQESDEDRLPVIIELLRAKTAHDFSLYKRGTLQRRVERRMAMVAIAGDNMKRYLELLRGDADELELLAKDLLINVTSFFRDPKIFDELAEKIVPDLIRDRAPDQPLRIWVAGCSTGEEAYSIAIVFREQIAAAKLNIKLQVFASDIDPDAVASAREGLYPEAIAAEVSAERLARFFVKENHFYRISPALRAMVVFTVQDVLADPPFSRLDLISCRNLLIYLRPEAQQKVISLFHFALRQRGVLLLGNSETIGDLKGRFEVISKSARLYRHIGHKRPGELALSMGGGDAARTIIRLGRNSPPSRQTMLAELCRRLVTESYAPAAILINAKLECVYSLGPTDRYLRVVTGHPTQDVLALAHEAVRTKLRAAVQQARQTNARAVVAGGRLVREGKSFAYSIAVQPVQSEGEELLLICFVDEPWDAQKPNRGGAAGSVARIKDLEQELVATRSELQSAISNLESSSEDQKAVNDEALSVNEELQSANEELLTSKEELQSLNEELTALNTQLQETLDRQRTTSNDLQNVLYSTNVATIFLNTSLEIRFFTPATSALFHIIPSDVGRPLADLSSLASDSTLLTDARTVLQTPTPLEREIEARDGVWFIRRILPYRTQEVGIEGVVITFTDITERKLVAKALQVAKQQAEFANVAKSRFLAAASHDLRQPLQTLALLQGLLAKKVEGEAAQKLIALLDQTLAAMSGMLNTLLDINQIEAGIVRAEIGSFPINDLLGRLRSEFSYHAQAKGIALHVVSCGLSIRSDPLLLEQMIRNLLSNAIKYTKRGKVLLGCRRQKGKLSIEIWDTGIGIPEKEFQAIFEEYHQLDNSARERSRGLGLGLSIVQALAKLLGHRLSVRSRPGKGSAFAIEVTLPSTAPITRPTPARRARDVAVAPAKPRTGEILIVEDDPEVRDLLELLLKEEGHRTAVAHDGVAALEFVRQGAIRPDLILADYNLPDGMNGLQLTAKLRAHKRREIPTIILTGDISTATLRTIALKNCTTLHKPVKVQELTQAIQRLLSPAQPTAQMPAPSPAESASASRSAVIFVVDDDSNVREAIRAVLEDDGYAVESFATGEAFLAAYRPGRGACLLIDASLPGMSGLELLRQLKPAGHQLPAIMITGNSDVPMAVEAMKAGASDFIEKPIGGSELLASVARALDQSRDTAKLSAWRADAASRIGRLTPRQRRIMDLVLAGHPSKNIAADLGISQRTVEHHRAAIMSRTDSPSLPALARLALAASESDAEEPRR